MMQRMLRRTEFAEKITTRGVYQWLVLVIGLELALGLGLGLG